MTLNKIDPTKTNAWKKLQRHFLDIKDDHIKDWFEIDLKRAERLTIKWDDFYVDYSKNRITSETIPLFIQLAEEVHLKEAISNYFSGDKINETEDRAVLHTALRADENEDILVDGVNVMPEIFQVRQKLKTFSNAIIEGDKKGFTAKPFTDIVNIGIGGSDLGPAMVVEALKYYRNHLNCHFISNVDGDQLGELLKDLNAETTLFIIVSKTFTTQETLANAETIREWFLKNADQDDIAKHFVAVSSNINQVKTFGIDEENIFPMWDWVGGRFSLWSAVGLSISLSVGFDGFEKLLEGARKMDHHFRDGDLENNIPVILAFLSVWYNNFFKAETEAVIPYTHYLNQFATYLQQAIMESNGKSVDRSGDHVGYQTGSVVWGEPGTNAQHAFFQLIHQGTKLIPAEFIGFKHSLHGNKEHHDKLMANFFAQTEALMKGKTTEQVENEKSADRRTRNGNIMPFKVFEGNKPTTTILIDRLTPESLGKLIAMYEHKIFVQGIIWNIFSYDQFGVELGKQLAGTILNEFESGEKGNHDASTNNLIGLYKD